MDVEIESTVGVPVATTGDDELMDFDDEADAAIIVDDEIPGAATAEEDTEMREEPVTDVTLVPEASHTPELEMEDPAEAIAPEIVLAEADAAPEVEIAADATEVALEVAGSELVEGDAARDAPIAAQVASEDVEVDDIPVLDAATQVDSVDENKLQATEPSVAAEATHVSSTQLTSNVDESSAERAQADASVEHHEPMGSEFFNYGHHDGSGDDEVHASGSEYYEEHDEHDEEHMYTDAARPDILVAFDEVLFSLFSLFHDEDREPELLLEGREDELCHAPLVDLLAALREELEHDESRKELIGEGEMCLGEEAMGLYVGEDNHHAHTITLAQMLDLYKGCQIEGPMTLIITYANSEHRFITRFKAIEREVLAQADKAGLEHDEVDDLGEHENELEAEQELDHDEAEEEFAEEEEPVHEEQDPVPLRTVHNASGEPATEIADAQPSEEEHAGTSDEGVTEPVPPTEQVSLPLPKAEEATLPRSRPAEVEKSGTAASHQELAEGTVTTSEPLAVVSETEHALVSVIEPESVREAGSGLPQPPVASVAEVSQSAEPDEGTTAATDSDRVAPTTESLAVENGSLSGPQAITESTGVPDGTPEDGTALDPLAAQDIDEFNGDELEDDGDQFGIDAVVDAAEKDADLDDEQLDFAGGEVDDPELVGLLEESQEGTGVPEFAEAEDLDAEEVASHGSSQTLSASGDLAAGDGALALAHSMLPVEDDSAWAAEDGQEDDFYDGENEAEWNDGEDLLDGEAVAEGDGENEGDVQAQSDAQVEGEAEEGTGVHEATDDAVVVANVADGESLGFVSASLVETRSRSPKRALDEDEDGKAEREVRQKR